MEIQANNIKRQFDLHAEEYEAKAVEVLRSGWYILGNELSSFESEFAAYIGARNCVGLASGMDALWISFKLLGIGPGDDVIVSANAYIACVMGITVNGANPVFVEPDQYDNIDAEKIEAAITPHTKAILAVHLFGQACDMTRVMDIAERHHLLVVEDCAQSHGNSWKGRKTGTFGNVACYSFYPTKGCGAFGDAGAVITNDDALAEKFRVFRNYGSQKKYYNSVVGANSRLDEIQAGLLRVKLKYLNGFNAERNRLADRYLNEIKNPCLRLPSVRPGADSSWHQFVIHSAVRDELKAWLKSNGIETIIHYPIPPYLAEAYAYLGYRKGAFPITDKAAAEVLSLPIYNGMTEDEQSFVIEKINQFRK